MITTKKLAACTFEEGLYLWNEGFKAYFVDLTFSMDQWMSRFGSEGLSPALSVVAYVNNELAGFVLNGMRVIAGKRVAWNGGTGVLPKFRGQGVGKALVQACIAEYRDHQVDTATLEAIGENTPAIKLYEQFGYRVIEQVTFLNREGALTAEQTFKVVAGHYDAVPVTPFEVSRLTFYRAMSPWQTQWQSLRDGQAVILREAGVAVGYALYKHTFNDRGERVAIALYQCVSAPDRADEAQIIGYLLKQVYAPLDAACRRYTVNIPASSRTLVESLTEAGFQTLSEQVLMQLELSE